MKIYIVGAGQGAQTLITEYAKSIIKTSDVVVTTKRLYDKFASFNVNTFCKEISEFSAFLEEFSQENKTICVLASGDIGFYSIARNLKQRFSDFDIEFVSGISSLQYLTAKLAVSYDDVKVVSVHGRQASVVPFVCYNKKVFALTGGKYKASDVIDELIESGLSDVLVTVGENLSDTSERIITDTAIKLKGIVFENLSVMLMHNERYANCHEKIYDSEFIRGKSPMTKETVRTLSVSHLNIMPTDTVVDIGAGTGSVTVEMARSAYEGTIYAIEKDESAISTIKENINKFCAHNIKVINAVAPEGLDAHEGFDKAFIGGSGGNLHDIICALVSKNKHVRIVVNAITLETLNEAIIAFKQEGFDAEISCVNVSNAHNVGVYHMMKAENPIYIIVGEKNNEQC